MTFRSAFRSTILAALLISGAAHAQTGADADGAPGSFVHGFTTLLYGESLDAARGFAGARLAQAPDDQTAALALGIAQFADAVQGLARDLQRHGLTTPEFGILPFFRLPVAPNPAPEPLTYDKTRRMLIDFVARMAVAEATLARVTGPEVQLPLRPALARFDTDGDGVWSDAERFGGVYAVYHPRGTDPEGLVDFDGSDAAWFQGYTHLLSALAEFWLAHDWHEGFAASFHALFPDAGLPNARLNDLARARAKAKADAGAQGYDPDSWSGDLASDGAIADAVAFFHLIHWPVAEPDRLIASRAHLKAMIETSRETWRRILGETDDRQEWIPAPSQAVAQGDSRPGVVTTEIVAGWMQFLDTFDAVLDGELLLPHWRLAGGINLRRVFEEPRVFDILLWIQGSAALPYLEDGPVADGTAWDTIQTMMGGEFMTYFVWFN